MTRINTVETPGIHPAIASEQEAVHRRVLQCMRGVAREGMYAGGVVVGTVIDGVRGFIQGLRRH